MRLDKNRWQEGAGLFIKKANANPYAVVAAYLGELEKIGNARLLKALERLEEVAAKRVEAGLGVTPELAHQIRGLRANLSPDAKAAAKFSVPGDPGEWQQGGLRMLGRREELRAAAKAPKPAPARVDMNPETIAAFEAERGAIGRAAPVAEADFGARPFRSRQEILGGGEEFSARGVKAEHAGGRELRARQTRLMEALPDSAVEPLADKPARAILKGGAGADRRAAVGLGAEDLDRPTTVSASRESLLGQADSLSRASAEAARAGDMEGSRSLALRAASFEKEFESISQARQGQTFRAGPSVEQVRGEPTAAMSRDPATAIQQGRERVMDATVAGRPLARPVDLPDSAVSPLHRVESRPPPAMSVQGEGKAAKVRKAGQVEVIPENVDPRDPVDLARAQGKITPETHARMMAERAERSAPKPVADIMGPMAPPPDKPAYVPTPAQEQNVMFGSAADGGTVSAQEAVQAGRLKASDPHAGGQKPDLTTDPPAQMAPQPVDAPNPPADLAGGTAANNPMAPTPEAPVAVAPVWKRRAALAGAGTLAAGGAFAAGYGGRQVIQPQQGQR